MDEPRESARAFIEAQLPVSALSKESYKERNAKNAQTLTGLGKWWGRKPLILVRAAILGLLMPTTEDPTADRATFLALLTMDEDGLTHRKAKPIPTKVAWQHCTTSERASSFDGEGDKAKWGGGMSREERKRVEMLAFSRMGYDDKLVYCVRPEEIDGPSPAAWKRINAHLGTGASSLAGIVDELGKRRFDHTPVVGDAFCGGGSIPFEAARIGCEAHASDLNPVAALLTWGAINIVGGGHEAVDAVAKAQREVYEAVAKQVEDWGLERNEEGFVADVYLYCNEVIDPTTNWKVPLAGSWVIGKGTHTVARLVPEPATKSFHIDIEGGVSASDLKQAAAEGTWKSGLVCPVDRDGNYVPPPNRVPTSAEHLRGRGGLRLWENNDLVPRAGDVFQERLYCIRWVDPRTGKRAYRAPTKADLVREERVLELLRERFDEWQQKGHIPSRRIEPGYNTDQPIRERGWTHWHQLFNPRQLLLLGATAESLPPTSLSSAGLLLALGRQADWGSRLSRWNSHGANEKGEQTFYNQAFNTLLNYACRAHGALETAFCKSPAAAPIAGRGSLTLADARVAPNPCDLWITDPGYADAVNYDEVSEFFLAWYEKRLPELFPDWYNDSKRALAIRGNDEGFRRAMVECYRRFVELMPDDGFQIVMFTHQDAEVWSDLALILWAAGLWVSAAWTVSTETPAGIRQGNYVQGTVLLVLRKRTGELRGDMEDIFPDVQAEIANQLESMIRLNDKEQPNFGDSDLQLAAYSAALRVLTSYSHIGEIDVERDVYRARERGDRSPLAGLIERAVKIASDFLVPAGLERSAWKRLSAEERFYLKTLEIEAQGEHRVGVFQEFARSLGVFDYQDLLASGRANQVRLKTPSQFMGQGLSGAGFAGSLLRKVLYAIYSTVQDSDHDPRNARTFLKNELADYWESRQLIIALLRYLAGKPDLTSMPDWEEDADAARLLLGSIENDSA